MPRYYHANQPLFAPCDHCGIPVIIYPEWCRDRDMRGTMVCDSTLEDRPILFTTHRHRLTALDRLRIDTRIERDRKLFG